MNEFPNCPNCGGQYTYNDQDMFICPECSHEWKIQDGETSKVSVDINGVELKSGDDVVVIKDLKIKGSGSTIKRGTKVKNIRLVEDDGVGHDIECKFPGVGTIKLKSSLVKK